MSNKQDLVVSFSGGRTSAYMSYMLKKHKSDVYNFHFVFMNTGLEHEKTLEFVEKCDKKFNLNLEWIESNVHYNERKSSKFTLTNFSTAKRNGEPFEAIIKKYGIPNTAFPHCTRELKTHPCKAWMKEKDLSKVPIAIGIRIDEIDRMKDPRKFIYPLISFWPTTKAQVNDFWSNQSFDLGLPDHLGNCVSCWKKSTKKLKMVYADSPSHFDKFIEWERKFGLIGPEKTKGPDGKGRRFFRQNLYANELLELPSQNDDDTPNGCSESCEAFADD